MEYVSPKQIAQKWKISDRRVRLLCEQGKIEGAKKNGKLWQIPVDSVKPVDGRRLKNQWISSEYSNLFLELDEKKSLLNKRRPFTSGEVKRLMEEFSIEYTYNSNAIEGSTMTLKETAMVLSENVAIAQKPLKEHLELIGHRDAFRYILGLVEKRVITNEKTIKDIHDFILMDSPMDRGVYRKIPVRILGASKQPPQPYMIVPQMEKIMMEYKDMIKTKHVVERVATFHLMFECVHPFIDGNGRTGRMIMNLDLMKEGFPPIYIKFTDRNLYYDAFESYNKNEDIADMVKLIGNYVNERLDLYLSITKGS